MIENPRLGEILKQLTGRDGGPPEIVPGSLWECEWDNQLHTAKLVRWDPSLGPEPTQADVESGLAARDLAKQQQAQNQQKLRDLRQKLATNQVTMSERDELLLAVVDRALGIDPTAQQRALDDAGQVQP